MSDQERRSDAPITGIGGPAAARAATSDLSGALVTSSGEGRRRRRRHILSDQERDTAATITEIEDPVTARAAIASDLSGAQVTSSGEDHRRHRRSLSDLERDSAATSDLSGALTTSTVKDKGKGKLSDPLCVLDVHPVIENYFASVNEKGETSNPPPDDDFSDYLRDLFSDGDDDDDLFGFSNVFEITGNDSVKLEMLSVSFSADGGFFSIGTSQGFMSFRCVPLSLISTSGALPSDDPNVVKSGFCVVERLSNSNILAVVGDGASSAFPPNRIAFWDELKRRVVKVRNFESNVLSVRCSKTNFIAVMKHCIAIHDMPVVERVRTISTFPNPKGLCCLSHISEDVIIACPGLKEGHIRIDILKKGSSGSAEMVSAHTSPLACIAITQDGSLIATSSSTGTVVKIFNIEGTMIQEVRRGSSDCKMNSLTFSSNGKWLALVSDKATVHVFFLDDVCEGAKKFDPVIAVKSTPYSVLTRAFRSFLPKYCYDVVSCGRVTLHVGVDYYVSFCYRKNSILIIGKDGSFYEALLGSRVGFTMTVMEPKKIL